MNLDNLKTEYEYFLETLNMAYSAGLDLYDEIQEIHNVNKNDYNMEWQLFYLKLYLEQIDDAMENISNNICIKEPIYAFFTTLPSL